MRLSILGFRVLAGLALVGGAVFLVLFSSSERQELGGQTVEPEACYYCDVGSTDCHLVPHSGSFDQARCESEGFFWGTLSDCENREEHEHYCYSTPCFHCADEDDTGICEVTGATAGGCDRNIGQWPTLHECVQEGNCIADDSSSNSSFAVSSSISSTGTSGPGFSSVSSPIASSLPASSAISSPNPSSPSPSSPPASSIVSSSPSSYANSSSISSVTSSVNASDNSSPISSTNSSIDPSSQFSSINSSPIFSSASSGCNDHDDCPLNCCQANQCTVLECEFGFVQEGCECVPHPFCCAEVSCNPVPPATCEEGDPEFYPSLEACLASCQVSSSASSVSSVLSSPISSVIASSIPSSVPSSIPSSIASSASSFKICCEEDECVVSTCTESYSTIEECREECGVDECEIEPIITVPIRICTGVSSEDASTARSSLVASSEPNSSAVSSISRVADEPISSDPSGPIADAVCTESDDGNDTSVGGDIFLDGILHGSDSCTGGDVITEGILEHFCDANGRPQSERSSCSTDRGTLHCLPDEARCARTTEYICEKLGPNAENPLLPSYTKRYYPIPFQDPLVEEEFVDFCISDNQVMEYICDGDEYVVGVPTNCPDGTTCRPTTVHGKPSGYCAPETQVAARFAAPERNACKTCSDCGEGFFNICGPTECHELGHCSYSLLGALFGRPCNPNPDICPQ